MQIPTDTHDLYVDCADHTYAVGVAYLCREISSWWWKLGSDLSNLVRVIQIPTGNMIYDAVDCVDRIYQGSICPEISGSWSCDLIWYDMIW